MGTNSTGCTEWERDFDQTTEQLREAYKMNTKTDWVMLSKEIRAMPNGVAVLRVLQAHAISHLVRFQNTHIDQSCTIEMLINYVHEER